MTLDPFVDLNDALRDFEAVAGLAGHNVKISDIAVSAMPAPHKPTSLRKGVGAVYCFVRNGIALKVGRTTANARFRSHHYANGRSTSSLAARLTDDAMGQGMEVADFYDLPAWIRLNVSRIDLRIDQSFGPEILNLLEAFLIARWRPIYEGKPE